MFRVYVGNLPYSVRDAELKDFFEKAGCKVTEATVLIMPDGRSKGFGFVSLEDKESFEKAKGLSGTDMMGRQVRVDEARPKEDRNGEGGSAAPSAAKPMNQDEEEIDRAKEPVEGKDKENADESAAEDMDSPGEDEEKNENDDADNDNE